ncbi:T9SS type A sorting domain-containing protein, partial [candidate division KSB1 bacterium]|nr:T9SS type A sorting domain-containing protein [candidate division KSB1 bacterium]
NDDTYDGTYNSKLDFKSFGDTGILIRGSNMEGRLGLPMRMVYMGANQDSLVGPELVENVMNPLKYNGQEQYYQIPIIASIPDTSQQQGAFIDIPVRIDDVTGLDIRSVSFRLTYDPAIIEFRQSIQFGTMTQTWNNATVTTDDSSVQVTVSGSSALTSAGDLIKLRFKVTGAEGSTSPLDLAQFTTNNNTIAIAPTDGTLSVLAPVMIAVTLPDTSEERGLRISIPVDVSDVTGLEVSAVSFEINFSDEVLEITGFDIQNSLTASWETAYLSQIPDGAQISLSGTTFLEGSGTLLYLNFDVIGNTGDTTALELSSFRFNDGVPVSSLNDGSFTVLQPPLLAIAVPDTTVVFGENLLLPIFVGDVDDYDVQSIHMTITYDQSVVEALSMTNEGTISSTWTDVQYTIEEGSIIASLSGEQALTGAGELIFLELAAIGKVGDTTRIKIEEITFNKGNPEGVKDSGVITILAPTVLVSMPDTTARNGELINVPVIVDDLSGLDVMSVKLTISYDSRVLDAIGVVQQGSLSEDKGMLTFRDYPGSAYVAFNGVSPLEGSGSLFFIQFSVIGGDSSGTELVFNYVTFNNGIPKSELSNGSLTVYGTVPRVQIALPDTNGFAGRSIKIPVFVDNLSDMDVTSVAMSITYNHDVLSATGITQNGTLSAQWQTTTPELLQGKINISLTGDTPLPTGDVLVYIDFDIVGAPESTTILHFESVLFNQGIPIATTRDGIFTTVEMPVLSVTLPDTGGYRLEGLLVPVKVGYLTDYEIRSFDCTISFNQDIVNAASIIKNNSLTAGWTDVIFEEETNLIHVQMSGIEALIGEGVLFFIEMEIIGQPGDSTGLEWQQFVFNEGIPQADTRNGSMRVFSIPEIVVALPDTTVMSGTSIQIPISVDDLTDKNVQYINTMISFNPNVLRCSGIDASNSIMSQWDDVTVNLFTNRVHLIFSGEKPLTGGGTLIYLNFDVIGADSSSTTLNFMYFRFNEGIPIAIRQNGLLRIEGVIPVELATFDAQYRHGAVYLTWSTATETNNYGFEIQKSIADSSRSHHWEVIGFVKGQGTTALHHSYEFVDHEMNGETLMYRLKQIDFDGRFTIYHSVMVDIAKPSSIDLVQNYPNPFNGSTLIRYTISQPGRVSVKVFNLLGKEVATLVDENQSTGRYTIDWYAKDEAGRALSSGIYFYRLESNGYMITKKMILLE